MVNNKFIEQFQFIIQSPELIKRVKWLLNYGAADPLFTNYFGINYNQNNISSLKIYFSYFNKEGLAALDSFINDDYVRKTILRYWHPTNKYEYVHRGLTLGLKCYLNNQNIMIKKYVHIRMPEINHQLEYIHLEPEDSKTVKYGICFEETNNMYEEKKYAYINKYTNIHLIMKKFNVTNHQSLFHVNGIEYTESSTEQKINISNTSSDDLYKFLQQQNNIYLLCLCEYLKEQFHLYFYSPGIRLNSETKAIYFVPKSAYYELKSFQTLNKFF